MPKIITITRKLEFYPIGELRNEFYSFFNKHSLIFLCVTFVVHKCLTAGNNGINPYNKEV